MLGNNNRQFKDLDYNTRTMIEKILKDDKLSGEDALIHDMLCDIFEEAVITYD